jgi:hypothetical protein
VCGTELGFENFGASCIESDLNFVGSDNFTVPLFIFDLQTTHQDSKKQYMLQMCVLAGNHSCQQVERERERERERENNGSVFSYTVFIEEKLDSRSESSHHIILSLHHCGDINFGFLHCGRIVKAPSLAQLINNTIPLSFLSSLYLNPPAHENV